MRRNFLIPICLALAGLLAACQGVAESLPAPTSWNYTDLRLLDPPDDFSPSLDLLAAYARYERGELLLRFDLLDIPYQPDYDLYIVLDSAAGGAERLPGGAPTDLAWEWLIQLSAHGEASVLNKDLHPVQANSILAIRNPLLDFVEIRLPTASLPGYPGTASLQVFTAAADAISDRSQPFAVQAAPPPPVPVLLAFWNTLPAYSPVQALRRWDGAHTGPFGGRHGLRNLLKAAQDYRTPLALLDQKSPFSLAALAYLGKLNVIQDMQADGLLILADVMPGSIASLPSDLLNEVESYNRQLSAAFGLPATPFLFTTQLPAASTTYRFIFLPTDSPAASPVLRRASQIILPVPMGTDPIQTTADGLTLSMRQKLAQTAADAARLNPTSSAEWDGRIAPLILGGDLTASSWGDPQHASAALRYLKAHPWVHLLTAHDLLAARGTPGRPAGEPIALSRQEKTMLELILHGMSIGTMPAQPLYLNAWHAYLALDAPRAPNPPEIAALRQAYLGQVNALLAAARWAEDPRPIADCSQDVDLDAQPECILASHYQYTQYEIQSGALTYAFVRHGDRVHQWIAPSSQFIFGLSDPALWQPNAGLTADPQIIPGAFHDPGFYQAQVGADTIIFEGVNGSKIYQLRQDGLAVKVHLRTPVPMSIPIAIDPWLRFQPDWAQRYQEQSLPQGWAWGVPDYFQVVIRTQTPGIFQPFTASLPFIHQPENPNQDYPPGHRTPFPLGFLELYPAAELQVEFGFLPDN